MPERPERPEERRRLGIGDDVLRLTFGIEGFEDLRSDLERVLAELPV